MVVVGLTGGIASGKTTVSRMFQEAGIPVICADELAHEAVEPGSPALEEIRRTFGEDVIDGDGGLDRARMAQLVFRDPEKRRILESIIHPRVAEGKNRRIKEFAQSGHRIVMVDVPLLYESGWEKEFDLVVVVHVPPSVQTERLTRRDNMTPEEARSRLDAQMPIREKKKLADRLVDNSGTPEETLAQVKDIIEELRMRAGGEGPPAENPEPGVPKS